MENKHLPGGDAAQLWQEVLDGLSALREPSNAVKETILFHGTVPKRYVYAYSLSFAQWLDMPILCWKFHRGRGVADAAGNVDQLNALLSKIEVAGMPLYPLEVQRIRRARLRHNLSEKDVYQSFSAIGIQVQEGRVHTVRQPRWCYWSARVLHDSLMVSALFVLGVALMPIVAAKDLPAGSVTLFMLVMVLSWMAGVAKSFGVQWSWANRVRQLLGY